MDADKPPTTNTLNQLIIGDDAIDALQPAKPPPPRLRIGRPRKYKNPEELLQKAQEYLDSCYNDKGELIQPVTITGVCAYIGTYRQQLLDYEHGDLSRLKAGDGDDDGFRDAIKHIKAVCESFAEGHMFGARNPAGAIFALKNYGWKDTQTIETTTYEIHSIDPDTRQLIGDYLKQLSDSQRQIVDITPQVPELVNRQSGGMTVLSPGLSSPQPPSEGETE